CGTGIEHQGGYIVGVLPIEIQSGRGSLACGVRNKNATVHQTLFSRNIAGGDGACDSVAGAIRLIACASIGSTIGCARNKSASVSAGWRYSSSCSVNGSGQAADPAIEIIPTQNARSAVACRIVFRASEVKFAEHATFIVGKLQQLGSGHVVRRELRIGKIVWSNGLVDIGANRVASDEHCGSSG